MGDGKRVREIDNRENLGMASQKQATEGLTRERLAREEAAVLERMAREREAEQ